MDRTIIRDDRIGEILRLLRISYDLSISELSKRTNVSKSYITEIEKGEKSHLKKSLKTIALD